MALFYTSNINYLCLNEQLCKQTILSERQGVERLGELTNEMEITLENMGYIFTGQNIPNSSG